VKAIESQNTCLEVETFPPLLVDVSYYTKMMMLIIDCYIKAIHTSLNILSYTLLSILTTGSDE